MKIKICNGNSCKQKFSEYILRRLENDKEKLNLENLELEKSPCMGKCEFGINISINGEIFSGQNPIKTSQLIIKKYKNENK